MSLERQCYEAGISAIQHIIEVRIQKGTSNFQRLDEDKHVPFVVPAVTWDKNSQTGSLNNDHWNFKVGYCFREALDLFLWSERGTIRKLTFGVRGVSFLSKKATYFTLVVESELFK